jgi:hypothetical protein
MRTLPLRRYAFLIAIACPALAFAAPGTDDRLTLSANGSTLSHADDGGGAAIGWLHNFNSNAIVGAAAEYQSLADSHWSFGSLSMSFGSGSAEHKTTFYADGHLGSGVEGSKDFDYATWVAGVYQNVTHQLILQLEDKQIDIDTTHGNLPKFGIQYLIGPRLLGTVSYAHSVSGNLGTRLGFVRLDYYGKGYNVIFGGAGGKASPDVVDIRGLVAPGITLREGFAGVGRTFGRTDMTLLGDYIKLGSSTERFTLTLNATVHLHGAGGAK